MKIEEQVLSIEQMKHLQELGVDTSDASMYWVRAKRITGKRKDDCIDNDMGKWRLSLSKSILLPAAWTREFVPTYTIGDLIDKLPKNIDKKTFTMSYLIAPSVGYSLSKHVMIPSQQNGLVDALYSLLCWVAENHKELMDVKK